MEALKVGIVGLQHLHPRLYMPLFADCPATQVVCVVEENEPLRAAFCHDFELTGYAQIEEMLEKESLDIAAIFLPHVDCPHAAELCAGAGMHLMVEKPMAESAAGAQRIVQAARQAQVKLTTGYAWRYHPVAAEIRRLLASGVIGQVVGGEGRLAAGRVQRYLEGQSGWMLHKDKSGGGPMVNLGVHWIDLFRWWFADEVVEVTGRNVKINTQYSIEDNSFAHLRFASGPIIALDISYTVPDSFPYGRDLYVSVRGTQGVLSWAPAYEGQKDVLFVCSDAPAFAGASQRHLEFELDKVAGYSGYMGAAYVQDFAQAIRADQETLISGADGVAVLHVVEAIYASDAQRQWIAVKP